MTSTEIRTELLREMSPLLESKSAMLKILDFVRGLLTAKEVDKEESPSNWASRYAGAWKDSRSAEEIINDIREGRTTNSRNVEL